MTLTAPATLLTRLAESAQRNMARDGELATALIGYDGVGRYRCSVLQSPEPDTDFTVYPESVDTFLVPAPFQLHADAIGQWLNHWNCSWAAFIGEAWLYPPGPEGAAAGEAYLAGNGPSPSQHPDRVEAAFVSLIAPTANFIRMEIFDIERRPHRKPRLVPSQKWSGAASTLPDSGSRISADGSVSWISTWVEEILPQPDKT